MQFLRLSEARGSACTRALAVFVLICISACSFKTDPAPEEAAAVAERGLEVSSTATPTAVSGSSAAIPNTVVLHDHTYVYNPEMSDEFNAASLDTVKWLSRYRNYTPRLNDEWECYTKNGTRVPTGTSLKLVGKKTGPAHAQGTCTKPNYESGLIRSASTQKYGYFEASMRLPAGRGMWPAFWLIPGATTANGGVPPWPPEIDIMEMANNGREGPFQVTQFVHGCGKSSDKSLLNSWGNYPSKRDVIDFADGAFHRFAVEWTTTSLFLYVDGRVARTYQFTWDMKPPSGKTSLEDASTCKAYDNGPAEVIINLAMGGGWPGDIDDAALPQTMEIDYLRTYKY